MIIMNGSYGSIFSTYIKHLGCHVRSLCSSFHVSQMHNEIANSVKYNFKRNEATRIENPSSKSSSTYLEFINCETCAHLPAPGTRSQNFYDKFISVANRSFLQNLV